MIYCVNGRFLFPFFFKVIIVRGPKVGLEIGGILEKILQQKNSGFKNIIVFRV